MRNVLLPGEVPVSAKELAALRRKAAELDDYLAAIQSEGIGTLRHQAMQIRRGRVLPTQYATGWADGVKAYEEALGDELLARLRARS